MPFDHAAYAIFSADAFGDDTRVDDRAGEQRRDRVGVVAREVEPRRPGSRAAAAPTIPPSTNRGCSAATSRARAGEIAFAST